MQSPGLSNPCHTQEILHVRLIAEDCTSFCFPGVYLGNLILDGGIHFGIHFFINNMHVFVTVSFMRYSIDHARLLSCGPANLVSEIVVVVSVLGVSAYVSFGVGSFSIVSSLFSKILSQCVTPDRFRLC